MQIKIIRHSIYLLTLFAVLSCKSKFKEDAVVDPTWTKISMPHGWQIHLPSGFVYKIAQGIDSNPGYIISKKDSIFLFFDAGEKLLKDVNCSFAQTMKNKRNEIDSGFYKHVYHVSNGYSAYIDTIDNKVAVIIKPTIAKQGILGISLSDCKSGKWLGLNGRNIPVKQQQLVLQIFKTIKLVE